MDIPEQDKQAFIEAARRRMQPKEGGAAFGVYPSSGKRPEKLNVSRDVNMPAQAARGWVAGTLGLPGDIESLGRMAVNFAFGPGGVNVDETPLLPTSEFYQEYLPGRDERPAAQFASGLGALAGGAGSTKVAGAAVKGAKATGKALGPKAAEMAESYLQKSGLAPTVVKPKGGNWLSGSVEGSTGPLKGGMVAGQTPAERIPLHEELLRDPALNADQLDRVRYQLEVTRGEDAINNWIDTKLNKYIRNEMGTPEDPVRKLAERGVTHLQNPPEPDSRGWVEVYRQEAGFPREGLGQSPLAAGWENITDEMIAAQSAGRLRGALSEFEGAKTTSDLHAGIDKTLVKERVKQLEDTFKDTPSKDLADELDLDFEVTDANRAKVIEDRARTEVEGYYRGNAEDMLGPHSRHKVGLEAYDAGIRGEDLSWLGKIPEDQPVYAFAPTEYADPGFTHLIDELRNATRADSDLPANLRWKPEDLKKVTMEQAVERVAKINEYRAAKKAEANEALARNPATAPYKDYETVPGTQEPNQKGLAWKQIKDPGMPADVKITDDGRNWVVTKGDEVIGRYASERTASQVANKIGQDQVSAALKYEGEVMGHCVGGYCDDVLTGESQIYSLRDKKGEPHVTIETIPGRPWNQRSGIFYEYPELENPWAAFSKEVNAAARAKGVDRDPNYIIGFPDWLAQNQPEIFAKYQAIFQEPPAEIKQIKGKGNAAPKAEYLPFVQDFVRSGNWSKVGDLNNTGLIKLGDQYLPKEEVGPLVERASRFIEETPALREHREAQRAYENYSGPVPSAEYTALQRAAGRQVHPTIPYTYRELRAILDDPDAFADRNTDALAPNLERTERLRQLVGEQGYAKGGLVEDTDAIAAKLTGMDKDKALTHALRMANAKQEAHMAGGGLAKLLKGAKAAAAAKPAQIGNYQALPLQLPRAPNLPPQELTKTAERIARQQTGQHVRKSATEAQNLAGRSMKEVERLKNLDIQIQPTKDLPTPSVVPEELGQVRIALPGDISVADQILMSVNDLPIGAPQEGGPMYGLGKMGLQDPRFWASNEGPAQIFQNKVTDLANLYETPEILAQHLAMAHDAMNFAQHFADASLRAMQQMPVHPESAKEFNKIIREGYEKINPRTKERIRIGFPEFPGVENYDEAYKALKANPEMRKWFNNRMKVEKITEPLGLPSGKEIEYAIMEPELRNMEHSLTGLSVGRMKPGASLIPGSEHATYSHDIAGQALGRTKELTPLELAFPDASAYIRRTQRPQDFTGTIQKVFPHQVVDDQYINQLGEYYTRLKQIRGYKKGGAVKKSGLSVLNKAII